MNHQEWLEWRRGGIGASDAGIIMGVAPKSWGTLYSLWQEKVHGVLKQDNYAMQHGRDNEEEARRFFEKETGWQVFGNIPKEHPELNWLRATFDGLDIDGKIAVEIKCPLNEKDHFEALSKNVPNKYYPQVQQQMKVAELDSIYYMSYFKGEGAIVKVARDQAYIDLMLPVLEGFWQMVVNKTPPEKEIDLCLAWEVIASRWDQREKQMKALEQEKERDKQTLIELAGENSARGYGIRLCRSQCPGAIDYKSAIADYLENMRVHHPEIDFPDIPLEPYRKESFTKWSVRAI
jgi:putative phage-type endonuclease